MPTGWNRLGESFPLAYDFLERDALTEGTVLQARISDPDLNPRSRAVLDRWHEKTCLTIPIRSVDGPMGLLEFWDTERDIVFGEDDIAFALSLSDLVGESMRNDRLVQDLLRVSRTDELTGLANYRALFEVIERELARAQRLSSMLSLVMIDVNGFKRINDTFGHPAGDAVMRHVADLIRKTTRPSDVAARYGGDEFMIVLPDADAEAAHAFVERLRGALATSPCVAANGAQVTIAAGVGVASYPADAPVISDLIACVDARLYVSKRGCASA